MHTENKPSRFEWLSHVLPVSTALLALAMLVLTPIWAIRYFQQPFPPRGRCARHRHSDGGWISQPNAGNQPDRFY